MSQVQIKPPKLPINGILLVNKPQGLTSNAALQRVKHLFNAKKAGHTGSLDPMATGMLPICFGEATKFCQYLLDADKCYQVVGRLGIKTNTGDATGVVTWQAPEINISHAELEQTLLTFLGDSQQIPTMFSALKHQGTPLYRLARAGIEVERAARPITISKLELTNFDGKDFAFTVTCSKGTYIRNLVEDLGDKLHVGAHVTVLHRCFTLGFVNEHMYSLDELLAKSNTQLLQCLVPMERAVMHLPKFDVTQDDVENLYHGRSIQLVNNQINGCVRLHALNAEFIGLGDVSTESILTVRRLLSREK